MGSRIAMVQAIALMATSLVLGQGEGHCCGGVPLAPGQGDLLSLGIQGSSSEDHGDADLVSSSLERRWVWYTGAGEQCQGSANQR